MRLFRRLAEAAHASRAALSLVLAGSLVAATVEARAQAAPPPFYKGKQIRLVVGSVTGGGYDLYARALAANLGRYIPGSPLIIVQNLPAAGSVVAANDVFAELPQDGTVIGAFQPDALFGQILGTQPTQFVTTKFQWLGSLNQEAAVALTWFTSKVRNFDDLLKEPSEFGVSGPNMTQQYTSLLIHLFNAKVQQVAGYPSVISLYPAIERGEVEGVVPMWGSIKASVPQWLHDKKVNVVVQFAFSKQPDLPDVPLITDFVTDRYLRPGYSASEVLAMLHVLVAPQSIAWPYGVGPGVPTDRTEILRQAFREVTRDEDFLAAAAKMRRGVNFLDGPTVQKMFEDVAATPKSTLDLIGTVTAP